MAILATLFLSMSASDRAFAPWAVLLFSIPFFLTLAVPLYYRSERRLVVDPEGVHLFRGVHLQTSLPWNRISLVAFGPWWCKLGLLGFYKGFRLMLLTSSRQRIIVFDAFYRIQEQDLPSFAHSVVLAATERSIATKEVPASWTLGPVYRYRGWQKQ